MSLLPKPQENVAKRIARQIDNTRSTALDNLTKTAKETFRQVWSHREKTPQEILNEFGTNAAIIFRDHALTVQFILSINPDALTPEDYTPPYKYTVNNDGTVTVGDKIVKDVVVVEPQAIKPVKSSRK